VVRIFALAATLALALSSPALGGGWAVTTLDNVPDRFEAGQSYSIGYTIRQHGVTPVAVDRTEIQITHNESGKRLSFRGVADGPIGHYLATLTIPASGSWTWEVTQGPFAPHALGTLTVSLAATAAAPAAIVAVPAPAAQAPAGPNGLLLGGLLVALAGAAVLIGGQLAAVRRPTHT